MISFAGDVVLREGRVIIMRGDPTTRSLVRFIIRDHRIVGATMVNRTPDLNTIVKLIATKTDISSKHAELADPNFDLKTLLA
jgi:NAD(P)H-nitrite reductase large subunit